MKAVFRTDSSAKIGSGHLMRCLTLAERLAQKDVEIIFVCRNLESNLSHLVEDKGFKLILLQRPSDSKGKIKASDEINHWLEVAPESEISETLKVLSEVNPKIDWLIVDHYGLDVSWETALRPCVNKIMAIDDLANRKHDCDLLLDQNLPTAITARYDDLVPLNCRKLLGPEFALLRDEFMHARADLDSQTGKLDRIFIFLGGSDLSNETEKAIKAVLILKDDNISADIILGGANCQAEYLRKKYGDFKNLNFYSSVNNIATYMAKADLAIGAGGTTTWERAALGLPCLIITVADNQIPIAEASAENKMADYLGIASEVSSEDVYNRICYYQENIENLIKLKSNALRIVDGNGTSRVTQIMLTELLPEKLQ